MNRPPIRGWTKPLHERGMKAGSMPERLLIGPGSPPSIDPVYPELSPPPEPCPASSVLLVVSQPPLPSKNNVAKSICGMKPPILLRIASVSEHPYRFMAGFVVHGDTHAWSKPSTRRAAGM